MHISKLYAISFSATAIFFVAYFAFLNFTRPPIESFSLDWGWVGFAFIFGNGFFLSYGLVNKKVDVLDRLLLTIGLGFGVTFIVMILLGILWEVSLLSVLSTQLILLFVLGITAFQRSFRIKISQSQSNRHEVRITREIVLQIIPVAIIGVLAFSALYNALTLPAIEWDSLAYGVNYAKIIYQNGHIPLIAGSSIGLEMSAAYPPGFQLTAVSLYTFAGEANDFYYRILSPIFSLATLLVTYKFSMLINKNRTFSVYAVSALVMIPFFWELFIQETYIMALTLMLTSAAYFFYKAHVSDDMQSRTLEVIGILFCAFAALTSYMGLIAFGILLLYALQKRIPTKRIVVLLALGLAIILPWYLRNLLLLGNPVYPFFGLGYYLDPLLKNSTPQHFQEYTTLLIYALSTLVAKIGVVLVAVGIVFFTFSKRRDFRWALPLYLLLASLIIMAFHVAFPRYLILAIPTLSVIFSTLFLLIPKKDRLPQIVAVAFIVVMILTSASMLPYINTVKPQWKVGESQSDYLSGIFEEEDAWQWINQNTPTNTRIATFDIKEYYLDRDIFYLDGNEAAPLYKMSTIQECLSYLQERGVGYILSVPWASPMAATMPPAYNWNMITRYLGETSYLPPVFVGEKGTAVYHVGPLPNDVVYGYFGEETIPPLKYAKFNVNIINNSSLDDGYAAKRYLPIPVDYRNGTRLSDRTSHFSNITISVNSSVPVKIELWHPLFSNPIANSPYAEETALTWNIDLAGHFTIKFLLEEEDIKVPLEVTLITSFYSTWEIATA